MKDAMAWSAVEQAATLVENKLETLLTNSNRDFSLLFESMRYSMFAGGKRIRPFLVMAFSSLFGGQEEPALSFAASVEMVHTYSLIHDDLPCMDNDDYRRGKLANHKMFDEASAVLTGDAMLTLAFEILVDVKASPEICTRAVKCLAAAAGARGMVGGQIMDIKAEKENLPLDVLCRLQNCKTGSLIAASVELGCIAAGVFDEQVLTNCRAYAHGIGRAFQIIDDILDVYGDQKLLGKNIGQDARDGKITYLTYMTKDAAFAEAKRQTDLAKAALKMYSGADLLLSFADALLNRKK